MLHAFAFGALRLQRVYASNIPTNHASQRLFQKLGYQRDDAPAARAYMDQPDDITLSLARERFYVLHGAQAAQVQLATRASPVKTR